MSTAFGIAAVSAVLKGMVREAIAGVADKVAGQITVSAMAPDSFKSSTDPRLNIFMYSATPNSAWRNSELPSVGSDGIVVSAPALALDLHYIITAYGNGDFEAEILLGCAMQKLHERPVLTRSAIAAAMAEVHPDPNDSWTHTGLDAQPELVKLSIQPLSFDELTKLWTALPSGARPSAAYTASVVLIQPEERVPMPGRVLEPRIELNPSVPREPTLIQAIPPDGRTTAIVGDTVVLRGQRLARMTHARLTHIATGTQHDVAVSVADLPPGAALGDPDLLLTVTTTDEHWRVGAFALSAVRKEDEKVRSSSNVVPLLLAPSLRHTRTTKTATATDIEVTCTPIVRADQSAALTVARSKDQRADLIEASPLSRGEPDPASLVFRFIPSAVAFEPRWLRMRVDAIPSTVLEEHP